MFAQAFSFLTCPGQVSEGVVTFGKFMSAAVFLISTLPSLIIPCYICGSSQYDGQIFLNLFHSHQKMLFLNINIIKS